MRYYDILISDPSSGKTVREYTSMSAGQPLPNALDVELDVFAYTFALPGGGSYVRVWGIPLQDISYAQNFVGMNILVKAGMQKGLPLANPVQSGVIAQGQVYQALGNWINTDMTLDLYIQPYVGTIASPANIVLSWTAGTPLATALRNTLAVAFPKYALNININANLILANDEKGYYNTLTELSQFIKVKSSDVIGGNYPGADINVSQNTIYVYDGTTPTTPKPIVFTDLIGQPTWIEAPTIQIKTVMRADIQIGDYISLPNTPVTITPQSFIGSPLRNKPAFQGSFQVVLARHSGRYRQPDAASWVSIFNANPIPTSN